MTGHVTIADREIGFGRPCFVIAEIGINHGGDESRCAAMIEAAAAAGADAAKLQTVDADASYHPETESHRAFRGAALSRDALLRLMALAEQTGIVLFSTPGDLASLALIADVGMPAIKISSGLLTNTPLIRAAARTGRPLILSTGMADMSDVDAAVAAAGAGGCRAFALLQCTSLYPAPTEALNLRAMACMLGRYAVPVGYSDHHDGALAVVAAAAAGANLIEKHFTLDRSEAGADHAISLEADDFARMVQDIRSVEAMLGRDEKAPGRGRDPIARGPSPAIGGGP